MEYSNKVGLKEVYDSLTKVINGKALSEEEKLEIQRFRDKLTVSAEFATLVNTDFSGIVMGGFYGILTAKLKSGKNVNLWNGFKLIYKGGYWDLYKDNKLFLDNLDFKLARKIGIDINVAILIYNSRLNKN